MTAKEFGARLKELRKARGFTQRELANQVGVDFSYLSKIENGTVPPPSEKVISRIATALKVNENELLTLGGRIPSDIAKTLQSSRTAQVLVRIPHKVSEVIKMSAQGLKQIRGSSAMAKVTISLVLVMLVSVSLYFASPVKAFSIGITNPVSGTIGTSYTFNVNVDISTSENLPISDVTVYIYRSGSRSTYQATLAALPLVSGTKTYGISQTGDAGTASVTATASSGWAWGYGYRSATFEGSPNAWGYGYGYGGPNSIGYYIAWTSPSSWPNGTYLVEARVTAGGTQFTKTGSSIAMSAVSSGGFATQPTPGTTSVSSVVDSSGKFTQTVTAKSVDAVVSVTIPKGVVAKTKDGAPLSALTIVPVSAPGPSGSFTVVGQIYDLGPSGATFNPPITITFKYNPADIPAGKQAIIGYWDSSKGVWEPCEGSVADPATGVITLQYSHFTPFSVLAVTPPTTPAPTTPTTVPATTPTTPAPTTPTTAPPTTPAPTTTATTPVPPTTPPVVPPPPTNWWLVGGLIVATLVIIGALLFMLRRRKPTEHHLNT